MKLFTLVLLFAASSASNAQDAEALISYKKGACFGKCPIYSVSISDKGLLTYEGKRFVDSVGRYERQLSKKEFRKVKRKFKRARIHKIKDQSALEIMDAPLTTFTYKDKILKSKTGTLGKLKKAEKYLLGLTPISENNRFNWTFTPPIKPNKTKPARIENHLQELIVQLNDNVEFQSWLKEYYKYGVRFKKKLVPNRELYLLSFQPRIMGLEKIMAQMKEDDDVHTVEQNKKNQQRQR